MLVLELYFEDRKGAIAMSKTLWLVLVILSTTGCSNKAIYDSLRANHRNMCSKEPPSTYFECVENTKKSYREYERERRELLEKSSTTCKEC